MIIIDKIFTQEIKEPLYKLVQLSQYNVEGREDEEDMRFNEILSEVLESRYFNTNMEYRRDSYDCHARFGALITGEKTTVIGSSLPLCLAQVVNEKYFYCRGNLTEGTKSQYDEIIPSRDYSSHSYEWKYLYSVERTDEAFRTVSKRSLEIQIET